jgi:glycosyltransferase involved in cell wall biosynthesis
MPSPLVSVIVPVYNGARYLCHALDSALGQTDQDLQVIVVDDGSTDDSSEVIASYGSRLIALHQPNAGVAHARNAGLGAADGELIAFLDQDDWWLPAKIAAQVERFLADPQLGLVHTGIRQYSDAAATFVDPVYDTSKSASLQGNCYDRLVLGNSIFNSSVMIRKTVLDEAGQFDPAIAGNTVQDYDLWLRIARCSPLGFIPDELTVLRLHGAQGTWNRQAMLADELRLLERHVGLEGLCSSDAMSARVAMLLDELGRAYLDARSARAARRCFARALGMGGEWRTAALYALSFLPPSALEWLRRRRAQSRGRTATPKVRALV